MNTPNSQRKELSQFLAENVAELVLMHMQILSVQPYAMVLPGIDIFDIHVIKHDRNLQTDLRLRIFAIDAIDYSIRPRDPNIILGGRPLKFSTDDPRLNDRMLQMIPGGDGKCFDPPRRYQLLELDQSYIIAQRFEVEELLQLRRLPHAQSPKQSKATTGEHRP
jgi:hypothetical protein